MEQAPQPISLAPNFPNPFNGGTTLGYRLEAAGYVSLKVYDLLGREVTTLVDGTMEAGEHEVWFGAEFLGSGTYLARLMAAGTTHTRPMVLIK